MATNRIPQEVRSRLVKEFASRAKADGATLQLVNCVDRLSHAASDTEFVDLLMEGASLTPTVDQRSGILSLAVGLCMQVGLWDGMAFRVGLAREALRGLPSDERTSLLAGSLDHAEALAAWETGKFSQAALLFATLARRGGYYQNVAYTYLGLEALRAGRNDRALECLRLSVPPSSDEFLAMRGFSRLLLDALATQGLRNEAMTAYMAHVEKNPAWAFS